MLQTSGAQNIEKKRYMKCTFLFVGHLLAVLPAIFSLFLSTIFSPFLSVAFTLFVGLLLAVIVSRLRGSSQLAVLLAVIKLFSFFFSFSTSFYFCSFNFVFVAVNLQKDVNI